MHPVHKTCTAGQQVLKSALRGVHPSCHSMLSTHNLFFLPGPEVEKASANPQQCVSIECFHILGGLFIKAPKLWGCYLLYICHIQYTPQLIWDKARALQKSTFFTTSPTPKHPFRKNIPMSWNMPLPLLLVPFCLPSTRLEHHLLHSFSMQHNNRKTCAI